MSAGRQVGQKIFERSSSPRVARRTEHVPRLVEHQVELGLLLDAAPTDTDIVGFRIDLEPLLRCGPAVHRDRALSHKLFARTTGRHAACCKEFVEADLTRRALSLAVQAPCLLLSTCPVSEEDQYARTA